MGAELDELAALQDRDGVGVDDPLEPVRDEDGGRSPGAGAQRREQGGLGPRVERRGGLVGDEEALLVAVEAAGRGKPLPLAAGEVDAGAELGVQELVPAVVEALDHFEGPGVARGPLQAIGVGGRRGAPEPHRGLGGEGPALDLLGDHGDVRSPQVGVDAGDVDAVPEDAAGGGRVEAGEEFGEGGLAGAVLADEGDGLAAADGEGDAGEGVGALAGVAEGHVADFDELGHREGVGGGRGGGGEVGLGGDALGGEVVELVAVGGVEAVLVDLVDGDEEVGHGGGALAEGEDGGGGDREGDGARGEHPQEGAVDGGDGDAGDGLAEGAGRGLAADDGEVGFGLGVDHRAVAVAQPGGGLVVAEVVGGPPGAHEPFDHPQSAAAGDAGAVGDVHEAGGADGGPAGGEGGGEQERDEDGFDDGEGGRDGGDGDRAGHEVDAVADEVDDGAGAAVLGGFEAVGEHVVVEGGAGDGGDEAVELAFGAVEHEGVEALLGVSGADAECGLGGGGAGEEGEGGEGGEDAVPGGGGGEEGGGHVGDGEERGRGGDARDDVEGEGGDGEAGGGGPGGAEGLAHEAGEAPGHAPEGGVLGLFGVGVPGDVLHFGRGVLARLLGLALSRYSAPPHATS